MLLPDTRASTHKFGTWVRHPGFEPDYKTGEGPIGSASGRNDNSIEFRRIRLFSLVEFPDGNIRIFI